MFCVEALAMVATALAIRLLPHTQLIGQSKEKV
jgi:hypothetical protein